MISPYQWLLQSPFILKQELVWFNRSQNFDKIRFYPMTERVYWLAKDPKTKLNNVINHHDVFDTKDWPPEGTKKEHTRGFPVKMCTDLISCFPDARVILDPYLGSGTLAIAALTAGRDFIGIELEPKYCELAEQRISDFLLS